MGFKVQKTLATQGKKAAKRTQEAPAEPIGARLRHSTDLGRITNSENPTQGGKAIK